ncbi:AMP-binding enzyme [gut metagenome]|uniref:AMP-binding enzyme n=1 Tax=gut metagenome TaxID=749906 RepID=J9G3Y4_9ZZZZ
MTTKPAETAELFTAQNITGVHLNVRNTKYPDFDEAFANGLKHADIEQVMEENRVELNTQLPAYSQISKMKIYPEEFEKTPKKSIKRYLYQEAKG